MHAINLRLAHLKYALSQNLITSEEYYVHRLRITNQYSPSNTEYKPCTLTDFSNMLKTHSSLSGELKFNQSFKLHQYSIKKKCEVQKSAFNTAEKINQQNKTMNLNGYFQNEKQSNNNQTQILTKSKKKRIKKKKLNIYSCKNPSYEYTNINNTEVIDDVQEKYFKQIENTTKKRIVKSSKDSIKIFVRQTNKKYKSETTNKESLVLSKRTVRDIFSKILKELKKEKLLY